MMLTFLFYMNRSRVLADRLNNYFCWSKSNMSTHVIFHNWNNITPSPQNSRYLKIDQNQSTTQFLEE